MSLFPNDIIIDGFDGPRARMYTVTVRPPDWGGIVRQRKEALYYAA